MFAIDAPFSSFDTPEKPTPFARMMALQLEPAAASDDAFVETESRELSSASEAARPGVLALGATVKRILGVAAALTVAVVLNITALIVAELAYAPYSISPSTQYAHQSSAATVEADPSR